MRVRSRLRAGHSFLGDPENLVVRKLLVAVVDYPGAGGRGAERARCFSSYQVGVAVDGMVAQDVHGVVEIAAYGEAVAAVDGVSSNQIASAMKTVAEVVTRSPSHVFVVGRCSGKAS